MTEADLDSVLLRGAWRLRAQRALSAGLAAFGLGVVAAAGLIFVLRLCPVVPVPASLVAIGLPVLCGAGALSVVFVRWRPVLDTVALVLDARAGTAEHLVTWYQLRSTGVPPVSPPTSETVELQRGFRQAQAAATLALGARFDPQRLIPFRLPEWGRALWLALLLLCCALLMPPRARGPRLAGPPAGEGMAGLNAGREGAGLNGASAASHAPRVQVLNPTDLLVFQLKATDPLLPASAKADLLKDLLKKIGAVPENELPPEVRELLDMLRNEVASKNGNSKTGDQEGKQPGTANNEPEAGTPNPLAAAAQIPEFTERAMATVAQNFGDVKEQLDKYYSEIRNSKSEIRRKEK